MFFNAEAALYKGHALAGIVCVKKEEKSPRSATNFDFLSDYRDKLSNSATQTHMFVFYFRHFLQLWVAWGTVLRSCW